MERFKLKQTRANKIYGLCRLCGMDNPGKVRICDQEDDILCIDDDDPPLNRKIEVCTGIIVDVHDNLPQMCCSICSDKICDFYEFRLMCTSTDIQTRKILGLPLNSTRNIDEKPDIKDIDKIKTEIILPRVGPKSIMDKKRLASSPLVLELFSVNESSKLDRKYIVNMDPAVSLKRIKIDTPIPKIVCSICETVFTNEQDVFAHKYVRHVPTTLIKYGCTSCGYAVMDSKEWNSHKVWHSKTCTPFKCSRCDNSFMKYIDYSKHHQMKCSTQQLKVTVLDIRCELCRKKFVTRNLYQWHNCFIKHRSNCKKCGRYFAKKQKLFDHFIGCPLPFIDFPKTEEPETISDMPETSAAAPPVNSIRMSNSQAKSISQVAENELIIKAENADIDMEQIDNVEEGIHTFFEKSLTKPTQHSRNEKTEKRHSAKIVSNSKSLKIRIKRELPTTNESQKCNYNVPVEDQNDLAYIPQEEGFIHLGSDDETVSRNNLDIESCDIIIKQEKLSPDYGDVTNYESTMPDKINSLNEHIQIKTEVNADMLTDMRRPISIKTEKVDHSKKKRLVGKKQKNTKSKNLAANFAALALKIKKEKEDEAETAEKDDNPPKKQTSKIKSTKNRSFVKINPVATLKKLKISKRVKNPLARVKSMGNINDNLALKIKKEIPRNTKKHTKKKQNSLSTVQIKKEPRENYEDTDSSINYFGLNPLSLLLTKKKSNPIEAAKDSTRNESALPIITRIECSSNHLDNCSKYSQRNNEENMDFTYVMENISNPNYTDDEMLSHINKSNSYAKDESSGNTESPLKKLRKGNDDSKMENIKAHKIM